MAALKARGNRDTLEQPSPQISKMFGFLLGSGFLVTQIIQ